MSKRGVRQLRELIIRYSDSDGSSRGVREWIRNDLIAIATNNPDINIRTEIKRAVHPFLRGNYYNGNSKTIGVKNMDSKEVHGYAMDLRNQIGRRVSGGAGF